LSLSPIRVSAFPSSWRFRRGHRGDLARAVAAGDRGRDFGDVADFAVKLPASSLTLSVRSSKVPANAEHVGLAASLPSVPTSRADARHLPAKALSWSTMVLGRFLQLKDSPDTFDVIFFDRSPLAAARSAS